MGLFSKDKANLARQHEKALEVIADFSKNADPVRVEIENTPHYFYSKPLMRGGALVLTIPSKIQAHLSDGEWLRVGINLGENQELRIQVGTQEKLELGRTAKIFCRLPTAVIESRRRGDFRIFTGNFKDLVMELPGIGAFRIQDISSKGMRIQIDQQAAPLVLGKPLDGGGRIQMGSRAMIKVKEVVPRFQASDWAGLEFSVGEERLGKILGLFLDSLDAEIRKTSFPPEG